MAVCQQQPFLRPKTPFTGPLLGGLQEGKSVIIIGRVLVDANRFHVNLKYGSNSEADNALHINPRYEEEIEHIVYNTYQNCSWGKEEKSNCPFIRGQPFILQILVTKEAYKITANGKYLMDYKHRIPFNGVYTIFVDGMVELEFIGYQYPAVVPYKTMITGGLQPGKDIFIYGFPTKESKSVEFNLRHRYGIAFHYLSLFDENKVVCNTYENGSWGTEEKSGGVPFVKDELFQVKISCNKNHYDVFVNGQEVQTYKHRFTKLDDIDIFEVYGQLQLIFVYV
ncbi:galectin-9-like [Puntigrus tetrazona]|uniref:galectin-9-like n=1 Tax=Puntigrus tetrazona TaxID=1606681 RepID=UPI001C894C1F|nr:galectin-9-like [Puntigrus tetrazona]